MPPTARLITSNAFLCHLSSASLPWDFSRLSQPPHPSAVTARAFAGLDAADAFCSFIPSPDHWCHCHFSDGRSVLCAIPEGCDPRSLAKQFVVCDPLHRRYLLLPVIPNNLASLEGVWLEGYPWMGDDDSLFGCVWLLGESVYDGLESEYSTKMLDERI
uniref:Uncharacterized protein n=1 Tax=Oryza punctata TaxID=4537 RepID=A0A0E0LM27_ORYPU